MASRAALSSVGVGDSTASPTAALLLSILQESAGRIATILFAYRLGSAFEPECKRYRLLADVFNDIGFVLDCLSPAFPKPIRVLILSFSSVLRALCGVAAGSAKASLSAHFARRGNLAELNAKDSSQETVISLMGMLAGSLVVSWVTTPFATWTTLVILLSLHLETNRRAVRAVSMRTLSRQRATLVYHHLSRGHVPTPNEIAIEERVFETDNVLRAANGTVLGYCKMGSKFSAFLRAASERATVRSYCTQTDSVRKIFSAYKDHGYFLWTIPRSKPHQVQVTIKRDAAATELLVAWWHALAFVSRPNFGVEDNEDVFSLALQSMSEARRMLTDHEKGLRNAGWDLDTNALETAPSARVHAEV